MEHYIKLLTIFIWKFAIFWSWQLDLWNLGQLAPASFFYLQQATMIEIFMLLTIPRIRQKDTFQDNITVYYVENGT